MEQAATSDNSNAILFNLWKQKLLSLFELLDSDYDGYISSQKIDISKLSNETLDVLTPLLLKIEEFWLVLNFEQFFSITVDFWKWLSLPDRNIILGIERELFKSPPEQHPFVPELTENTRAIIEYSDFASRRPQLHENYKITPEKENNEFQECTFKPSILNYNPQKFRKGVKSKMNLKETIVESMFGADK